MITKEKLKEIQKNLGVNQKEYADILEVSRQTISDINAGKSKAGEKILRGILKNIPDVDMNWLLSDKGELDYVVPNHVKEAAQKYILSTKVSGEFEKMPIQKQLLAIFQTQEMILRKLED